MKEIKSFKKDDKIPSNAKFIAVIQGIRGTPEFCYEVPIVEKEAQAADNSKHIIIDVIKHLNKTVGGRFTVKSNTTISAIRARINEGRTLEDFIEVIDRKSAEWLDDPQWSKYLRPSTLFGSNFDGYLSHKSGAEKAGDAFDELDTYVDNSISKSVGYGPAGDQ